MSTLVLAGFRALPSLIDGERLDQPTFHERYVAMPEDTRAELVDGVVHMMSSLRYGHGEADGNIIG
jgi:hypothetical protein